MPRENKFHLAWNERSNTDTWITVGRMGGGCLAKASVSFWKRDKRELKQYESGQARAECGKLGYESKSYSRKKYPWLIDFL